MTRFLAVLALVALVGVSGCSLVVEATYRTTKGKSWRELLWPTWDEFTQQIQEAREIGQDMAHDERVMARFSCDVLLPLSLLGGQAGGEIALSGLEGCWKGYGPAGLGAAGDAPQAPHPPQGPGTRNEMDQVVRVGPDTGP